MRLEVRSKDELGALAESFNEMAEGLAQREKTRGILGMVVGEQLGLPPQQLGGFLGNRLVVRLTPITPVP